MAESLSKSKEFYSQKIGMSETICDKMFQKALLRAVRVNT